MKKRIKNGNDFLLSLIMLGLALFLLVGPQVVKGQAMVNMGGFFARADVYIRGLALMLLVLAVLLLIKSIDFSKKVSEQDAGRQKLDLQLTKEVIIAAVALVLYTLFMPIVGFIPSTFVLVMGLTMLYVLKENEDNEHLKDRKNLIRTILFVALYSVILVAVLYFGFTKLLRSVLP